MPHLPQPAPERGALQRECALLREELARLLVERAHLLGVTGPELEARYRAALGALQLEVLEAECAGRRLRRKLALLRASLNRGAVPDLAAVEAKLDAELADWRQALRDEALRLEEARARLAAPPLGAEAGRELRALFRALARRCHPDANPDGGDDARALWLQASAAYAAGDLDSLRAMTLVADEIPTQGDATAAGARERSRALRAAIARLAAEVEAIRESFPFSIRERLEDPDGLAADRASLLARRDALADGRVMLEAAVAHTLTVAGLA